LGQDTFRVYLNPRNKFNVYLVDPCIDSLENAKIKLSEVDNKFINEIYYHTETNHLPDHLDFVINATTANHRIKTIEELIL